ncbi:MAG: RDD family protein [Bacilli bacterium]|jgi:uncharacterized RDD family membrane protein YckC|nr:RDD family protein [Bacilli bacterium]
MEIKRQSDVTIGTNNGRRFGAFFIDAVITAMMAMVLFAAAGAPMFGYYSTAKELSSVDVSLVNAISPTHLLEAKNAVAPSDSEAKAMGESWLTVMAADVYYPERDCLRYYTVVYKEGAAADYQDLMLREDYEAAEDGSASSYAYLFEKADAGVSFKPTYKKLVRGYLEGTDLGSEAEGAYNSASSAFSLTYRKVWLEFGSSDAYKPLYQEHLSLNERIAHAAAWGSLVSYGIAALICYIAIPLLNHHGQTIAKRGLKLVVVSDSGDLSVWQTVSRGLIEILEFAFLTLFAPFFFIQTNAISLPFVGSGVWTFNMFTLCLSSLLIVVTSGFLALFTKRKKSLHDLASFTTVVEKESLDALIEARQAAAEAKNGDMEAPDGNGNDAAN